jgi:carbon storage regulator
MLVLTRRENERIVIDGRITVTVVRVQGDRIRIGIEAPQEVPIMRGELLASAAEAVTAA